jgi:hypothetical protein
MHAQVGGEEPVQDCQQNVFAAQRMAALPLSTSAEVRVSAWF